MRRSPRTGYRLTADCPVVRPPTVIVPGQLIAGRHPCASGREYAPAVIDELARSGVTLFLDLTHDGELEPYDDLIPPQARYQQMSIQDFSVPTLHGLVDTLDAIDAELEAGGLVFVHCWAGCGRTGVVVGSWLVRHGADPNDALRLIADARGAAARRRSSNVSSYSAGNPAASALKSLRRVSEARTRRSDSP